MFGKNSIKGPKDYKDLAENEIQVTSIFHTIQGEGPFGGEVASFVRFTGCNLRCSFCDTWFDSGDVKTFAQIQNQIVKNVQEFHEKNGGNANVTLSNLLVVLTGGEPMLQKNIVGLIEFFHGVGWRTQIESNGTLLRDIPKETTLVCSPKADEKYLTYNPLRPDVYERANVLKFVVSADETSPYHQVPEYAKEFAKKKTVYVSPMNTYNKPPEKVGNNASLELRSEIDERISFWTPGLLNPDQNQKNHEYAALLAMKYNFKLNLQAHLYASLP